MLLHHLLALAALSAAPPAPLTEAALIHKLAGHDRTVRGADFSPDGRRLASVCEGGLVRVWDLRTGKAVVEAKAAGALNSVQFSPDGRSLVTAGPDQFVRVFDAATGKETNSFSARNGALYVARFTPDAKEVVACGTDPRTRAWEAATGKEVRSLPSEGTYGLAVSGCGKYAVTGNSNDTKRVTLWDLHAGKDVRSMAGHTGLVVWLEFSPDGRTVASCSYDGTVRLWEARTGKERLRLAGFTNSPRVCAFSPDARLLAVADYAGLTRLYDSGGKVLWSDQGAGEHYAVALSPDGRYLCSGGEKGRLMLWDVSAHTRRPAEAAMPAATFERHWADLASDDAAAAFKAVVALSSPAALKHLAQRFAPPRPLTAEAKNRVPGLIGDLAGDDDAKRKKAADEMAGYGPAVLPMLREALKKEADADAKLRLVVAIDRADAAGTDEGRLLRAVEALERSGPAGAGVLRELAKGERGRAVAAEAKSALARLERREAR